MGGSSDHTPSLADLEGLHSKPSGLVAVVDGQTAGADENGELLEAQVGGKAQGLLPVSADVGLPATPEGSAAISTMRGDAISQSSSQCEGMRGRSWAFQAAIHSSAKRSAKSLLTTAQRYHRVPKAGS